MVHGVKRRLTILATEKRLAEWGRQPWRRGPERDGLVPTGLLGHILRHDIRLVFNVLFLRQRGTVSLGRVTREIAGEAV